MERFGSQIVEGSQSEIDFLRYCEVTQKRVAHLSEASNSDAILAPRNAKENIDSKWGVTPFTLGSQKPERAVR